MDDENLTPAMRQYVELKKKYSDCVIMFRMGDFYEMFYEDAVVASKELEITLTSRGKGEKKASLAGIPYHALDNYLGRFVKKGYKIAICEQLEDPKFAKGLVKRGIVRIVTPGTLSAGDLDSGSNNFLMSLFVNGEIYGVSFCDVSTGEFFVYSGNFDLIKEEILRFNPKECIVPESLMVDQELIKGLKNLGVFVSDFSDRYFSYDYSKNTLLKHFNVLSLDGFGVDTELDVKVAGGLLNYILETQMNDLLHIKNLKKLRREDSMFLDNNAIKHLELLEGVSGKGSLFYVLNKTSTPMGARLLKKWLKSPLLKVVGINKRLDAVEFLVKNLMKREGLRELLNNVGDIERLVGKLGYGSCNGRDLIALKNSLLSVRKISFENGLLGELSKFGDFQEVIDLVCSAIKDDCNVSLKEGNVIKLNYNIELSDLYEIKLHGKRFISSLEAKERGRTGIKNLRIGFNRVFGYYIDVSNSNLDLAPKDYIRKQTLVNNERFVTEELKREEERILTAEEKIKNLEFELFNVIAEKCKKYILVLQDVARKVGELDVILSFSIVSVENNYVRPLIDNSDLLEVRDGRHPVVETEEDYIANDVNLKNGEIMVVTGPNFSGKSCYMRQVSLIVIMAQMGCFVPASLARIGIVDRVFTRIGASDDLFAGKSTFMVEMEDVANILNNATSKSLVILDEVGRGTSTYDGVSVAWAVVEHIYNKIKCKTIFATHYHVLNSLEKDFEGINNYNIAVKEEDERIVFLRKLVKGGTDKSFGIYVAKMAGVPLEVVNRAKEIQESLEKKDKFSGRVSGKAVIEQKRLF